MEAVAHSPAFAKKVGVPQSVGKEFSTADKGKQFSKGGDMKKMAKGGAVDVGNSMKMGSVRTAAPSKDGVASKGKTKGKQIVMSGNKGMKAGGMAKAMKKGGMAC
jgi:hypothetical protein